MLVYGLKSIGKELGCNPNIVRRIIKKHPEFPAQMLVNIGMYACDVDKCKEWWIENRSTSRGSQTPENAIQQNEFARRMEVSARMVQVWRKNGLEVEKLANGTVWIMGDKARLWFLKQSDERTRAYAEKLRNTTK